MSSHSLSPVPAADSRCISSSRSASGLSISPFSCPVAVVTSRSVMDSMVAALRPHLKCRPECIASERQKLKDDAGDYIVLTDGVLSRRESPFSVPMEFGWQRAEFGYTSPCGLKRYTLSSIRRFLSRTGSKLSIDQFNLDLDFNCFVTRVTAHDCRLVTPDVANASENLPIPCVNGVDDMDMDPFFLYSPHRLTIGEVDLNVGVVSGCQCTDRCLNPLTCKCRLLTEEADDLAGISIDTEQFGGYVDKCLTKVYVPGMYECNEQCSCGPQCQNRVSQQGIRCHLQVFRVQEKGWGLRCLHDLPAGYFVCLYSGEVMSDQMAEQIGPERGDEYFVSLNLIEMVEEKLGYESDVLSEAHVSSETSLSDERLFSSDLSESSSASLATDSRFLSAKRRNSEDSSEREGVDAKRRKKNSGNEKKSADPTDGFVKVRRHLAESLRADRGQESAACEDGDSHDSGFVIDAKRKGNAGRFLNHSCSPNCQLQNIFTETHDPRFPVMAFFTVRRVPALEELTWDYLYEDGVDVFHCHCGSDRCKSQSNVQAPTTTVPVIPS